MWKVGDLFQLGDDFYEAVGNYLGAVGQVNQVAIVARTQKAGEVHDMMVPEKLLDFAVFKGAGHYRRVEEG